MDRTCLEKRQNRRLCCSPRVDAWRKEKKRLPKNHLATNGGTGTERCRLEHMELSTPCSCRPNSMEEWCPSLVCLLAQRELRRRWRQFREFEQKIQLRACAHAGTNMNTPTHYTTHNTNTHTHTHTHTHAHKNARTHAPTHRLTHTHTHIHIPEYSKISCFWKCHVGFSSD
jgi:hypothetical protein